MEIDFSEALAINSKKQADKKPITKGKPRFSDDSTFTTNGKDPDMVADWKIVNEFSREIINGSNPRWLTLSGVCGCGKSHLGDEIWMFLGKHCGTYQLPKGRGGEMITQAHYILRVKACDLMSMRINDAERFENRKDCFFLLIDDIGASKESEYYSETLLALLDARIGMWTIVTTNLSNELIAKKIDQRVASRLRRSGNRFYEMKSKEFIA